MMRLEVMLDTE
jgi:hypothetical protein